MNATPLQLNRFRERLSSACAAVCSGRIRRVVGALLEAEGLRGEVGDLCMVRGPRGDLPVEIVGFHESVTVLLPLTHLEGISPGTEVIATGAPLTVAMSDALLGRVLDGLGRPLDDAGPIEGVEVQLSADEPPNALTRRRIDQPLDTGIRALDLMCTLGQGQRIGIFAGSGVGKSTLLGMLLREAKADVTVLALIGERGREVRQFLDVHLDEQARRRAVVVAATSDRPALQRIKGAHLAASIAEHFRDAGKNVLLVMDSATRFAMALREAGLAAGEPPTTRGYPPSLYSEMPRLVERFGTSEAGSITALLTVLVEGDDLNEPVSDCLRGLLDGHVVLSRSLTERGHFPPIDVLQSLSRLMPELVDEGHRQAAEKLRGWLALYEDNRDLIEVGAYRSGSDPTLDLVLSRLPAIKAVLCQGLQEHSTREEALQALQLVTRTEENS